MSRVTVTKTIAAAGDYTAGDVVSESASNGVGTAWRFGGIENRAGEGSHITRAFIVGSEDSLTAVYKLWLFSANPSTSELDDNAAKNFSAADMANLIGIITFKAMADQGATSYAEVDPDNTDMPFHVIPVMTDYIGVIGGSNLTGSSIWGVLEDTSGETAETASMTLSITLVMEPAMQLQE
jgi:hypothetical protein